jgi:thymidylate synthase (FAD)
MPGGAMGEPVLVFLERIGRTCYKSEDRITVDSGAKFVRRIIDSGHESVIEHASMSVRFICDRGVTHELVRHRLCAFSQESTRYCNYSKNKFGSEITVIEPCFWRDDPGMLSAWREACERAERAYMDLLTAGAKPEQARSVLPNSLKTEIVCTANLREWRHIFRLRTSERAHPQMREVMRPLLVIARRQLPEVFNDVGTVDGEVPS